MPFSSMSSQWQSSKCNLALNSKLSWILMKQILCRSKFNYCKYRRNTSLERVVDRGAALKNLPPSSFHSLHSRIWYSCVLCIFVSCICCINASWFVHPNETVAFLVYTSPLWDVIALGKNFAMLELSSWEFFSSIWHRVDSFSNRRETTPASWSSN